MVEDLEQIQKKVNTVKNIMGKECKLWIWYALDHCLQMVAS